MFFRVFKGLLKFFEGFHSVAAGKHSGAETTANKDVQPRLTSGPNRVLDPMRGLRLEYSLTVLQSDVSVWNIPSAASRTGTDGL
jgi:hypothetical protein